MSGRCPGWLAVAVGAVATCYCGAAPAQPAPLPPLEQARYVEYYATLPFRESPFADLIGLHRMTEAEAQTRNHLRFELDDRNRPIRVTFMLGDSPRPLNDHVDNFFFGTTRVDIRYDDGLERRRFFDAHGNAALFRGVFEEIYELDALGYRRRLEFRDADGETIASDWGIAEYVWRIEKDGLVIEDHFDLEGKPVPKRPNLPFMRLRLHYGPGGYLALMENYGTENRLVNNELDAAQDKLEYEADGDMRAWNVYDENEQRVRGNSPMVARGIREFDDNGYIVRSWYEDENGERMRSAYGWGETVNTYDRFGNLAERWSGDEFGQPDINPQLGYHGYRMRWDESGRNNTEIRFFGTDRTTPAIHANAGAHRIAMDYDEAGNRTRIRYFDADGRQVERADNGVATLVYRYDERNRLVEQRLFGLDGSLTEMGESGWAVMRIAYDAGGGREVTRLDAEMKPIAAP